MKKNIYIFFFFLIFAPPLFANDINDVIELIQNEKYNEALQSLEQIKASFNDENQYIYHYYKGKIFFQLKDFQKAVLSFSQSVKLNSRWSIGYNDLGLAYLYLNNKEQARLNFYNAISQNKTFSLPYYNLANLFLSESKYDQAVKNYQSAAEYEKDNLILSKIYLGLGNAYQSSSTNNVSKALESYKKSYDYDNNNWKAYWNLGLAYFKKDLYTEAIESFQKVITLNKEYYDAYFYIATCYRGLKNYPEMEKYYNTTLTLNPVHKDTLFSLSSYYAFIENKPMMLETLKKLFSVDRQYKKIILKDNLFKKYLNDDDFKKLTGG